MQQTLQPKLKRADLQLSPSWSSKSRESKTSEVIRSLSRKLGSRCMIARVERVDHVGHKHDLFGLFDLLVAYPDRTVGVQVCGSDWSTHINLYKGERLPNAERWLGDDRWKLQTHYDDDQLIKVIAKDPRREFQMWGWRKLKRKGKQIWIPRVQNVTIDFLRGEAEPEMLTEISEIFDPNA